MKTLLIGALACGIYLTGVTAPLIANEATVAPPTQATEAARPTDVYGAMVFWRDAVPFEPKGWSTSHGKGSPRSPYEIYSRYISLSYLTGIPIERAMTTLDEVGRVGPEVDKGWYWDDYARMGEAALRANRPAAEAIAFLRDTYAARESNFWYYEDYTRAAAAAFVSGRSPRDANRMLEEVRRAALPNWSAEALSRVAEAALTTGGSPIDAARMLEEVYQRAQIVTPGWKQADLARVARAALLSGTSAETAVRTLNEVYLYASKITDGWGYVVYSRLTAAALIARKSPLEAVQSLKTSWDIHRLTLDFYYADYGMVASVALIGRGAPGSPNAAPVRSPW